MPNNMPFIQLFVADFDNDTCGLSACATGVWLRMIMAMHIKKSGSLTGSLEKLSQITRCSCSEIETSLNEFETENICDVSRESNGNVTIICRRMYKEEQKRVNSAERTRKHREKKAAEQENSVEETDLSRDCNSEVTRHTRAYHNSYTIIHNHNNNIIHSIFCFDEFWDAYDKKNGKKNCEKLYAKISEQERAKIKEHVPKYVAATPDKKYRKDPQTYLKGECWNDEIICNVSNNMISRNSNTEFDRKNRATHPGDENAGKEFTNGF